MALNNWEAWERYKKIEEDNAYVNGDDKKRAVNAAYATPTVQGTLRAQNVPQNVAAAYASAPSPVPAPVAPVAPATPYEAGSAYDAQQRAVNAAYEQQRQNAAAIYGADLAAIQARQNHVADAYGQRGEQLAQMGLLNSGYSDASVAAAYGANVNAETQRRIAYAQQQGELDAQKAQSDLSIAAAYAEDQQNQKALAEAQAALDAENKAQVAEQDRQIAGALANVITGYTTEEGEEIPAIGGAAQYEQYVKNAGLTPEQGEAGRAQVAGSQIAAWKDAIAAGQVVPGAQIDAAWYLTDAEKAEAKAAVIPANEQKMDAILSTDEGVNEFLKQGFGEESASWTGTQKVNAVLNALVDSGTVSREWAKAQWADTIRVTLENAQTAPAILEAGAKAMNAGEGITADEDFKKAAIDAVKDKVTPTINANQIYRSGGYYIINGTINGKQFVVNIGKQSFNGGDLDVAHPGKSGDLRVRDGNVQVWVPVQKVISTENGDKFVTSAVQNDHGNYIGGWVNIATNITEAQADFLYYLVAGDPMEDKRNARQNEATKNAKK